MLFLGAAEAIEVRHYSDILKIQKLQEGHKVCLRQRAGDSTNP
jgi:hypothetical protein